MRLVGSGSIFSPDRRRMALGMGVVSVPDTHFADRRDAGRKLATVLRKFRKSNALVLALPRGGVPVGYEVAREIKSPLDVVFVREICAPGHPEVNLGAVVDGVHPEVVLNDEIVRMLAADPQHIEAESHKELAEVERRRHLYRPDGEPLDTTGRTVILVDDGVATGRTVKAALRAIDRKKPEWLVLAVPVCPMQTLLDLQSSADEVICLTSPEPFWSVGAYYEDFTQTTDEEVRAMLRATRGEAGDAATPHH